jgi:polar amino acid transport system ATP-binding protein
MPVSASSHLLVVDKLSKSFGSVSVLDELSLTVDPGEVVCVIGPSGGGKSTLLRCVNHLERPSGGLVFLDGELMGYEKIRGKLVEMKSRALAKQRRKIGMVFQHFNLLINRTALENIVEGPVQVLGVSVASAREHARELLEQVGLAHLEASYPSQLSGGQQQRVAIARALAMRPRLIMFDEPTSALDPELVGGVLAIMRQLAADGMTMLVVTHEIAFARSVANRVAFVADGRVVEIGPPESVIGAPQHERTRKFLNELL